jgi:hypothetical protein
MPRILELRHPIAANEESNLPKSNPSAIQDQFSLLLQCSDVDVARLVVAADPNLVQRFIARAAANLYLIHPDHAEALLAELTTVLNDPLMQSLAHAPYDDEPFDEEDLAALNEGLAELEHGQLIPDAEIETWIEK